MKTISLKAVQNGLSRDEMRAVKGGCFGFGAGRCYGSSITCADDSGTCSTRTDDRCVCVGPGGSWSVISAECKR